MARQEPMDPPLEHDREERFRQIRHLQTLRWAYLSTYLLAVAWFVTATYDRKSSQLSAPFSILATGAAVFLLGLFLAMRIQHFTRIIKHDLKRVGTTIPARGWIEYVFVYSLSAAVLAFSVANVDIGNLTRNAWRVDTMDTVATGVFSGIATAALLGIIAAGWRKWREWRVKQLGDLMQDIIEHRNQGLHLVPDPAAWVAKAKALEEEAERRADKVSKASGIMIHSLGEFPTFPVDRDVRDPQQKHYVSLLTAVISRIRDTLARHDR